MQLARQNCCGCSRLMSDIPEVNQTEQKIWTSVPNYTEFTFHECCFFFCFSIKDGKYLMTPGEEQRGFSFCSLTISVCPPVSRFSHILENIENISDSLTITRTFDHFLMIFYKLPLLGRLSIVFQVFQDAWEPSDVPDSQQAACFNAFAISFTRHCFILMG